MNGFETGKLLKVNLRHDQTSPGAIAARYRLRDHYSGAKAAVFMDKDETMQDPDAQLPSDPGLGLVLIQGEKRGVLAGMDSNSSPTDLLTLGEKLGMGGVHVAERGAVIAGLKDKSEIQLIQSGFWLNNLLLNQFAERIHNDSDLNEGTAIVFGDPWAMINGGARIPGAKKQIVMLNSGRHASAGMVTALLDAEGNIIRRSEESRAFFGKMADLFLQTRDALQETIPFPDPTGMMTDRSERFEVVNIVSLAADKRIAMEAISKTLNIPIYHIGDNEQDDMHGIEGVVTMAVGNNTLRHRKGVIAAIKPMASGIIELYEKHILPKTDKLTNLLPEPKEKTIARYEENWRDVRRKVLRINGVPMMVTTNDLIHAIDIQEGDSIYTIGSVNNDFNWRGLTSYIIQKTEEFGLKVDISQGYHGYTDLRRMSRDGKKEIGNFTVITGLVPKE